MIELQKHGRKDLEQTIADAPLDVMTLLSMPDHLRKTAMAVCRLGRATADEIAQQNHRAREVDSAALNQPSSALCQTRQESMPVRPRLQSTQPGYTTESGQSRMLAERLP